MKKVLLTAYGPYDEWPVNASWLVMQEVTRELPETLDVTTRLYPVHFQEVEARLRSDLADDFDVAIHLGQAPGSGRIALEQIGVNVARERDQRPEQARLLAVEGPPAYASRLPLGDWARQIREAGIPAEVSHHAGTYLCNAALYLAHHIAAEQGKSTQATFLHLPIDPSQAIASHRDLASLPAEITAHAVRLILQAIACPAGVSAPGRMA